MFVPNNTYTMIYKYILILATIRRLVYVRKNR